jgi:hypothetical protein
MSMLFSALSITIFSIESLLIKFFLGGMRKLEKSLGSVEKLFAHVRSLEVWESDN